MHNKHKTRASSRCSMVVCMAVVVGILWACSFAGGMMAARSAEMLTSASVMGLAKTAVALPSGSKAGSAILIEKSAPQEVIVGVEFDYVIKATNLTDVALEQVSLTEQLPEGFKIVSTPPGAAVSGKTVTWSIGTLQAKASQSLTIRGAAAIVGAMKGCSQVSYKIPEVCLSFEAVQPTLVIVKTSTEEIILCDPISSKIVVTNIGTGTASNVVIRDALPAGLRTFDGKHEVVFDIGTLGPGQAKEFTFQAAAEKTGVYVNKATVTGDPGLTAESVGARTVVRNPVLVITKKAPGTRYLGRPVKLEIVVANTGDAPATDTMLTDTIPSGVRFVSASEGGNLAGGKVTWKLGTILPGRSKTVSLELESTKLGEIHSVATAKAYCTRGSGESTTIIKGIPAILLECIDLADPIELGANETYQITVTNQGSATDSNVLIKCVLPAELEFVSATAPVGQTVEGKVIRFAPLPALEPGQKAVYKVVTKGVGTGDTRFRVVLTSDQIIKPVEETESTNIYK